MRKKFSAAVFAVAAMLSGSAQARSYSLTDLGSFLAVAINDSGQVAGNVISASGQYQASIYSDGVLTKLGTFNGSYSEAFSINNAGQVVGTAGTAFLYSDGTIRDLGTLGSGWSWGYSINNSGQVVGSSAHSDFGLERAFLYSEGTMIDINPPGSSYSYGMAINDAGQVAGLAVFGPEEPGRASLYSGGSTIDLGTLGPGGFSIGYALNELGEVTGFSALSADFDAPAHAFLYTNGRMSDLGTLGGSSSYGNAISDAGHVVGYSETSSENGNHAFIYADGKMMDLNDLVSASADWELRSATGINSSGQIVGWGFLNGMSRGFLLSPIDPAPEPATWLMLLGGLGAVGGAMRRGRLARATMRFA